MEGRVWKRPFTEVQKFEANEYEAPCGERGVVYKIKIDSREVKK